MFEILPWFLLGVVTAMCWYFGYRAGLRLGMRVAKGMEPAALKNPLRVVKEMKDAKAAAVQAREESDEWDKFMSFDGYTDAERAMMNRGGD